MNNPLSVRLGPLTFGLPYRFGNLDYQNRHESWILKGVVREKPNGPRFTYEARLTRSPFAPCPGGSLDEFLLERYTAFTAQGAKRRLFRIWHPTWDQQRIEFSTTDAALLIERWPWFERAHLIGSNYSPGAEDVWMGRPHAT